MLFFLLLVVIANLLTVTHASLAVTSAILVGVATKDTQGKVIKKLSTGDFIIGGHSTGTISGANTNAGNIDFLIQRYDSSKTLIWSVMAGGSGADTLYDIAIDGNDNIYAVGSCTGTVDLIGTAGGLDFCLFKFNSAGVKQWTNLVGGGADDIPYGVAVNSAGTALYAVGNTLSNTFDGKNRVGSSTSIWAKFDAATGAMQSSIFINNLGSNYAYGIVLDSSENSYVVGSSISSAYNGIAEFGSGDCVLSKYTSSGTGVWHKRVGNGNDDSFAKVAIDASDNVYAFGYSVAASGANFGGVAYPGSRDCAVQGYTSAGTLIFSQLIGGSLFDECLGGVVDSANSILYLTGYSKSTFYGDNSGTSAGFGSTFLVKLATADGSIQESAILPSSSSDTGNSVLLSSGTPYIVGKSAGNYGTATLTGNPDLSFLTIGSGGGAGTDVPTAIPTAAPFGAAVSDAPTFSPTFAPTHSPTHSPTAAPTFAPSARPTLAPSFKPTIAPTATPTFSPTKEPVMDSFVVFDIVVGGVFLILFVAYCCWSKCAMAKKSHPVTADHCFKGLKAEETA